MNKRISAVMVLAALYVALLIPFSLGSGWAAGPSEAVFRARIPDGLYLYLEFGAMRRWITFGPIMLVEKGKLVDPYRLARSKKGRDRIEKLIKGKTFNAFVGSDLIGQQKPAVWGIGGAETPAGKKLFAPGIDMREDFPGMSFKDIYVSMPKYVRNEYMINFGCPRPLLAPPSFTPSRKIEFLPVTEEDRKKAADGVMSAFFPSTARHFERQFQRKKGKRCTFEDLGSELDSLIAFDIDNNGKKDFVGIYTMYAGSKERDRKGERLCGFRYEILFVLMDTGRLYMLASNRYIFPGVAFGGVIDVDGDGILEIVTLTTISVTTPRKIENDYEDGLWLSIFRYNGNGWKSIYRTVPFVGGLN